MAKVRIPKKLQGYIRSFAKKHPTFSTPTGADNECHNATVDFLHYVPNLPAFKLVPYGILAAGNHPIYSKHCGGLPQGHYVIRLGKICIDFTARQFHPNFSFPKIWRLTADEEEALIRDSYEDVGGLRGWRVF